MCLRRTKSLMTRCALQAVLEAYNSGASLALIMEDDMDILRWPSAQLLFTAPPDWDALLLYMMGPDADTIYRQVLTCTPCGICTVGDKVDREQCKAVAAMCCSVMQSAVFWSSISLMSFEARRRSRALSAAGAPCNTFMMRGCSSTNTCRSPLSLWVPWHTKIFSAGAYIMHRPAMHRLLQALLPGVLSRSCLMLLELVSYPCCSRSCIIQGMTLQQGHHC